MAINFPSNPTNGQTITVSGITYAYDSTQGVWSDNPQGLTQAIDALTDVDTFTSAPSDGQVLQWNSTDSEWQPADASAGVTVYATIDDLPLTGVTEGSMALVDSTDKLYIYSDTGWYSISIVNQTPSITGVNATYTLATDGTATTVTVTATDPEGIPLTYSIVSDTSGSVATVAQGTGSNTNQWTITPSTNTADEGSFTLVFRASDGTNIASASSTFSLVFVTVVQDSNYTTALITSVGANNAVNNSFTDSSTNNHTISASGNMTHNTFSPYRHGGYSTYFDGSGDYLTIPAIQLGTSPFTIEMWVNLSTVTTSSNIPFLSSGTSSSAGTFQFEISTNSKLGFQYDSASSFNTSSGLTADTWHHVAIVREGTGTDETKLYLDGVLAGSSTIASDFNSTASIFVGRNRGNSTYPTGYITDVRVVSGTAVYTSAFTPPTERLTAITNTSLLTCHLPYIADGSTNGHSITVNGDTKTEPYAPYDYNEYSATDNGGSIYFDGSGDYLSVTHDASLQLGTASAFTAEFWIYIPAGNSDYSVLLGKGYNTGSAEWYLELMADGAIDLFVSNNGTNYNYLTTTVTSTLSLNTWYHIAFVRESTTNVKVYTNGSQTYSSTGFADWNVSTGPVQVGGYNDGSSTLYSNCYISDVRIVKGTAVYTSAFTPPTASLTAITNTSLLLNGTDAGIIDKSQSAKTVTLSGGAKSSTTQNKYLTSSIYTDGINDLVTIAQNNDQFELKDDFTVEFWFYRTGGTSTYTPILGIQPSNGQAGIRIAYQTPGTTFRLISGNGTYHVDIGSSTAPPLNTWAHFALTRSGSSVRAYIDGSQVGSTATSSGWTGGSLSMIIGGGRNASSGALGYIPGYYSDVRITKGLARYTATDETANIPSAALEG